MATLLRALATVVLAAGLLAVPIGAQAAPGVTCSERATASACDADGDRIADTIEVQVCGSATCATGREDSDRDGIADWVEVTACGSIRCASPTKDTDSDGIPDFAERFVCGSDTCAGGREDSDGDAITDWAEFVICGDRTCANGGEDYDADGVSDAKELMACVVAYDMTGAAMLLPPPVVIDGAGPQGVRIVIVWWPLIVGCVIAFLSLFFLLGGLLWQRGRARAAGVPA